MKVVMLEQPFASLLASGIISVGSSAWGVRPGRVLIGSKHSWSDACYHEALNWKTEILSIGHKSRSLMPLGKILGTAVVAESDLVYHVDEWKRIQWLEPIDAAVPIRMHEWAIRFSDIMAFPRPIDVPDTKPVFSLTAKAIERLCFSELAIKTPLDKKQ